MNCPKSIIPLQDHASSNEHETSHETSGVLGHIAESDSGVAGSSAGSSHRRSLGGRRVGGSGHGKSSGSRGSSGRRGGSLLSGVLGTTHGVLLAGALTLGVVGVRVDALAEIGLANEERHSLLVGGDIGSGSIAADTAEVQGGLFKELVSFHAQTRNTVTYRVARVEPCSILADVGAGVTLSRAPGA
jgi:hypothetical protein